MCLSIPSKVVELDSTANTATVDTMGVKRDVGLDLMQENEVQIGDYVLLHVGFVMNKISEKEALLSLETYNQILSSMSEQERQKAILEDA